MKAEWHETKISLVEDPNEELVVQYWKILTRDGGLKHDKEKVRNSCRKQWNFSPLSSHG